jgi:hypothetical protein
VSEEKLAVAVGNNWYEKGIDNFVILTGGLLAVARAQPDLVEGTLPMHLLAPPRVSRVPAPARRPATSSAPSRGGAGASADQNANANTRQAAAGKQPTTAGMASATCAPRSIPRPVQWNSLRHSTPTNMQGGSFYMRSFESQPSAGSFR